MAVKTMIDYNPKPDEIRRGKELGYRNNHLRIWVTCPLCGESRWVQFLKGQPRDTICAPCASKRHVEVYNATHRGKNSFSWKGGRIRKRDGYIRVKLQCEDFFYSMTDKKGYVGEHRLVMAKHLGRCLHLWEIVHHKNHIRDDNRVENLQLVTDERHKQITLLEERIAQLEKCITLLEAENALLKSTVRR